MGWLNRIFGSTELSSAGSVRKITNRNPLVIRSPRIGFFNLIGESADRIIDEDKAALGPLFTSKEEADTTPPVCDVLMIYARLTSDGRVVGSSDGLREIIRKSGAQIVIVASENEAQSYIAASKSTGYGQANLVMTLRRKDIAFTTFFAELFRKMFSGTSMPMAWVELAPQGPRGTHMDLPETIFAAEVSHIIFR